MNAINVKKSDLLAILESNREKHRAVFEQAQIGYRKAAIKELDSMLEEAKNGSKIRRVVSLAEPIDQTSDYDRVIQMMKMSIDDTIELEEHEFQQFVMDQWGWRKQWAASNKGYYMSVLGPTGATSATGPSGSTGPTGESLEWFIDR